MEMLWKKGWEWFKIFRSDLLIVLISLRNPGTPGYIKVLLLAALFYGISPIDLIPDFIPVLGYLDDMILLPAMVALTIRLIPPAVFARCRIEAEGLWANGKPGKWYFAIPIALFWCVILFLILRKFLHGFN